MRRFFHVYVIHIPGGSPVEDLGRLRGAAGEPQL
jgi:hypothetical protein